MKIAIIGTGNLGLSIAKGLLMHNNYTQLYLTKRNTASIQEWTDYKNVYITSDNTQAVQNSDILICTVQPGHFEGVLEEIKPFLTDKHHLISAITGFKIERMERIVGDYTPIVRAMPNTAIAVGASMTTLCHNKAGGKSHQIAEAIFKHLGHTLPIAEEHMQAATVLCASGIAFWMRLIRATTQGGVQMGFDAKEAMEMSMHTALGAAQLLIESGNHPEEEIDRVTTPQGCTIEGLNQMEHQGLSSSLIQGLMASFNKINQIRKA